MRRLINQINKLALLLGIITAIMNFDITGFIACITLYFVNKKHRSVSTYYLMFMFNLHFTMRYICIQLLNFNLLFSVSKPEKIGNYLLIAVIFYIGIAVAIYYSTGSNKNESNTFNISIGKISAISMLIFSSLSLTGQYSIGRELTNSLSKVLIRLSLFLQHWNPALFFLKHWKIIGSIYIVGMLIFGSKAFIYNITLYVVVYALITDKKIKPVYIVLVLIGGIASIMLFDVILAYRVTNKIDLSLIGSSEIIKSFSIKEIMSFSSYITKRWAGLDTLMAYGEVHYLYSLKDFGYEIITAINNLIPGSLFNLPQNFLTSELRTAYIFRGYNIFNVAEGGLRHTDSMFGLSRFISMDLGFGIILYLICLLYTFTFKYKDNFLDILTKIIFYSSVLLGGSYAETIKVFLELLIFYIFLHNSEIRKFLKYHKKRYGSELLETGA